MEEISKSKELEERMRKGRIVAFSAWIVLSVIYLSQLFRDGESLTKIVLAPLGIVIPFIIGYSVFESRVRVKYGLPNRDPIPWFLSPVFVLPLLGVAIWLAAM